MFFFDVSNISRDPFLHFVVPQFVRLQPHHLRMLHDPFPDVLPFIGFAVIADHQNGLLHDGIEVRIECFPFFDHLCFAYDHYLPSPHHGVATCGRDDRRKIRSLKVTTVHNLLVKLLGHRIECILCNILIHTVGVVRFLAAQHIHRGIRTGLELSDNIVVLLYHYSQRLSFAKKRNTPCNRVVAFICRAYTGLYFAMRRALLIRPCIVCHLRTIRFLAAFS